MAAPRRAAASDDAALEDLGTVTPARRAAGAPLSRGRLARMVLAPLAVLSVTGLAAGLLLVPPADPGTTEGGQATPVHAAPIAVSRSQVRPTLSATPAEDRPLDTQAAAAVNGPVDEVSAPAPAAPASTPAETPAPSVTPSSEVAAVAETAGPAVETPAASPSPTAEETTPAPTEEAEPTVDYSELGEAAGARYTTAGVNVRTGPGTDYEVRTGVGEGTEVAVTALEVDGWRQVSIEDKAGWIKASYLTETKPAKEQASSSAAGSSSGYSGAACAKAGDLEHNLTDRTAKVLRAVCAEFPKVSSYGGYRPGSGSYHGSGRAIDVMVSGEYGWQIAKWARSNASSLGIVEVIYEQKIWTSQRAGDGWRGMSNRGSASANHYDHVHISVR